MSDDTARDTETLAEVLHAEDVRENPGHADWTTCPTSGPCADLARALLPVVEQAVTEARGEALRTAADEQDAMCDTYRDQSLPGLANRRAFAAWLRDRADATATTEEDPATT